MKKSIFLIAAFSMLMIGSAFAQTAPEAAKTDGAAITFEEFSKDFGDISQGDIVEHTFKFTNSGNEPLILQKVQTTCGCTAAGYSKEPIMPGESSEINAKFNSTGKRGKQNKVITVISNATNNPARVSIVCNVNWENSDTQTGSLKK